MSFKTTETNDRNVSAKKTVLGSTQSLVPWPVVIPTIFSHLPLIQLQSYHPHTISVSLHHLQIHCSVFASVCGRVDKAYIAMVNVIAKLVFGLKLCSLAESAILQMQILFRGGSPLT